MKVHIPSPCHEDWSQMTPNTKGRHCLSCQKTVLNFTNKSDAEIRRILSSSSEICGRFSQVQINRTFEKESSPTKQWFQWGLVSAFLSMCAPLFSQKTNFSQRERPICVLGDTTTWGTSPQTMITNKVSKLETAIENWGDITFRLVDTNNNPIAFTKVLARQNGHLLAGAFSNFDGIATLSFAVCPTGSIDLEIRDLNYKDTTFQIDFNGTPVTRELVITAIPEHERMIVGMVVITPKHPALHKASIPFRRVYYGARDRFYRNQH